jgi:hypothetical protein
MSSPNHTLEEHKSFAGGSPAAARDAATTWLRDFAAHGPLDIRSIRVSEDGETFVATVVYTPAEIEVTPRHFPDHEPLPLLQSA